MGKPKTMVSMAHPGLFPAARIILAALVLAPAGLFANPPPLIEQEQKNPVQQGVDAYNQGDFDLAVAYDSYAIRLNPKDARAYANRGLAYSAKGDDDKAIADYSRAIRLDPTRPEPYYDRGNAYGRRGDAAKAIADFTEAIRLDPNDARAYNNRGQAYSNRGEDALALADFDQAIRLDPKHAKSYYNRGDVRASQGDYGPAIADFKRAIQLDPNDAGPYNDLAWILATCPQAGLRDGTKAVENATKACGLTEWKDPGALDTLAAACAEAGDFDSAVKWEGQSLATPNLGAKERADSKFRLALYQAQQPYHMEK